MKILLISNMYPDSNNIRYGIFVKNVVNDLSKSKFNFSFIVMYKNNYNLFCKLFLYIKFYIKIFKSLYDSSIDLYYFHYPTFTLLPLLVFYPKKVKICINFHGSDLLNPSFFNVFFNRLLSKLYSRVDGVIFPSQFMLNEFIKKNFYNSNLFVSPSGGVNTDIFYPKCSVYNFDRPFRIGFAGNISNSKGIWILINSLPFLSFNFQCFIVGDGKDKPSIMEHVRSSTFSDKIFFIDTLSQEKLADFYRFIDVFVFPTLLPESLGLVGLESLFCGTPVIGSNIGGISGYLVNNENGLTFNSNDYNSLISAINTLYNDKILYNNLSLNSSMSVQNFSHSVTNINLSNYLSKIVYE
ncbi:MAG: glycosyltransferase family 4 protein [Algoriphagus sp.]|uniref:glycosyltransferase family 4 protein n=1 Tax=Algoriphagus sp. TaxID=1872435 RepID=UPI003296CF27